MSQACSGRVAELVDALDSKSCELTLVRVRFPPRPPNDDDLLLEVFFVPVLLLLERDTDVVLVEPRAGNLYDGHGSNPDAGVARRGVGDDAT
jgi:hypothetical protein